MILVEPLHLLTCEHGVIYRRSVDRTESERGENVNGNGNQTMNYELCTMNCLTLCPIDTAPIDFSMLTTKEVEWLNQYHKRVRETLLPHLCDEADKEWLSEATKEISC